jgi:hypothetical protein
LEKGTRPFWAVPQLEGRRRRPCHFVERFGLFYLKIANFRSMADLVFNSEENVVSFSQLILVEISIPPALVDI